MLNSLEWDWKNAIHMSHVPCHCNKLQMVEEYNNDAKGEWFASNVEFNNENEIFFFQASILAAIKRNFSPYFVFVLGCILLCICFYAHYKLKYKSFILISRSIKKLYIFLIHAVTRCGEAAVVETGRMAECAIGRRPGGRWVGGGRFGRWDTRGRHDAGGRRRGHVVDRKSVV